MGDQILAPKRRYGRLLDQVQVNAPYRQLVDRYLESFLNYGINPEIGFDAHALETFSEEGMAKVARLIADC
ncbi:MAG: hypothetical protein OEU80_14370, partial [Deltaproteobacteria bacterium]|nr:hypothetical protein [Deltaproteobacteria bacterium]